MFDTSKIQAAAAAVAALLLTVATVGAAVYPARAAETERPVFAAAQLADRANA